MSIPPQLIRVKRKRDDESPVTFLQFDEGAKRHRSDSKWVYQRRHPGPQSPTIENPSPSLRDAKPVIHVSGPSDDTPPTKTKLIETSKGTEPRRFHISRKMMMASNAAQPSGAGLNKRARYGPAVFVERSRAKASQRASQVMKTIQASIPVPQAQPSQDITMSSDASSELRPSEPPQQERRLKKPAARSRQNSPLPGPNTRSPLPTSVTSPHNQDLSKITADMNDWVMKEIGANLQDMEQEKQRVARFKPKAPAKRYQERHPEVATSTSEPNDVSMNMGESEAEDDDDWIIEEYVRIPAHAMTVDVAPTDVGVLVLDGKEESNLFYGPERDEDEDLDEDDEDENAENYYTADYPEDEVESDDEYGRHPYGYRNGNASDDEEFDNMYYDESDNDMVLDGGDDDATMARIRTYMRHSKAFQ
ncbi:hypothetical protein FOC1_g10013922 [Fusarium oxysporum f. sp. cubense race 1]|uniref:Transcription factor Iwr1 domain-containing protein n=1 Tax=Fusarium oxysporum f. sp. cubense (strain race 1) TaxID=1229664 RepID=N4TZP0_FUSC1|nr:hypothetical protein FOC1_g10013922 [Fusarium oxysporum f. sp. cubense race 1]